MKVLVTQQIDPAGLKIMEEAGLDVIIRQGQAPISPNALISRVRGCVGLVSMPTDHVVGPVMEAGPLRVVANHAVGVDNIDLAAARQQDVTVTNTPGVLTEATADLTMALILAAARRVVEGDRIVRRGEFLGWRPMMLRGLDLKGARLGIVGYGRIGKATAKRAKAFGMDVVHHSRRSGIALNELLSTSDVVSLHCPLMPETYHLIGENELRAMKTSAILVNTSRGPVVDEEVLAKALAGGWIQGAALDVFEREPKVHHALVVLDQVILAPHLGSATVNTRKEMAIKAARNLVAVLSGKEALDPVV
jgi:glyoxylate reductase